MMKQILKFGELDDSTEYLSEKDYDLDSEDDDNDYEEDDDEEDEED